jgi:hypothetical protein
VCPGRLEWLRREERRAGVMIAGRELMAEITGKEISISKKSHKKVIQQHIKKKQKMR